MLLGLRRVLGYEKGLWYNFVQLWVEGSLLCALNVLRNKEMTIRKFALGPLSKGTDGDRP